MSELTERLEALRARAKEAAKAPLTPAAKSVAHAERYTPWGEEIGQGKKGDLVTVMKGAFAMEDPTEEIERFQERGDLMHLAFQTARHNVNWAGNEAGLKQWLLHKSDLGSKYRDSYVEVAKAMDEGTALEGGNWVPNTFGQNLHKKFRLPLLVTQLFEEIPMGSNTHDEPVDGPDLDARLGSETNSDDVFNTTSLMPAITPRTYQQVFTARDLQARVSVSSQLEQDAVFRVTEKNLNKLMVAHARASDVAVLMGDRTTGTYPDADVAADPTIGTRAERAWDGLRYIAAAGPRGLTNGNGVRVTASMIRTAKAAMQEYGASPSDLAIIAGTYGENQMLDLPELITVDKYGPNATIVTGEVGKIFGMRVVVTEKMKEDVSSTGYNTGGGPNTFIGICIVNTKSFAIGRRQAPTIVTVPLPLSQQIAMASWQRADFEPLVYDETAVQPVAWIRNLPQT